MLRIRSLNMTLGEVLGVVLALLVAAGLYWDWPGFHDTFRAALEGVIAAAWWAGERVGDLLRWLLGLLPDVGTT